MQMIRKNHAEYTLIVYLCLSLLFSSLNLLAQDNAFFAPPQSSGHIAVKLYPMENITPGSPVLVTFGMPFSRGSIDDSGLSTVRLTDSSGGEIPAHVSKMTPWRHLTDIERDGSSVRFALIQFSYTFSRAFPEFETIKLDWGQAKRTLTISEAENPHSSWHLVDSGTFSSVDSVYEPDVYAVLPREYLCGGSLKLTRMIPFDDSVPESLEAPDAISSVSSWPNYTKMDHAQHNFFFTLLNETGSESSNLRLCPYKTAYEPWLYDRSTAMFLLYMRSGFLKPLREAVRHAQYYRNQLWDDTTSPPRFIGLFRLKVPQTEGYPTGNGAMYSYNQCLAYNYWLTGDSSVLDEIEWVVSAHEQNDEPTRWAPSLGFWTERHTAFRLLANAVGFEVTGKDIYRKAVVSQYKDLIWHQNGAGGALPEDRIFGGLYHNSRQHGDGEPSVFVASSWMTVLTVDAMLRVYALTEDPGIGKFIHKIGDFERAACKLDGNHIYGGGPLYYADYMMNHDGTSAARNGSMVEHSLEIASAVAWAAYFSGQTEEKVDPTLISLAEHLYAAYETGVSHWIRKNDPADDISVFQVSPWRKYGWQYVPSGSLSWVMRALKTH